MKYNFSIFKTGIPLIISQVSNVILGIINTVMLGHYSKEALAAVGLGNQIFFIFAVFGMGLTAVITPLVSTAKAAKNNIECGELLRTSMELGFIVSTIIIVCVNILSYNIHWLNQSEEVNIFLQSYLSILSISTFPLLLFLSIKHFLDGLSFVFASIIISIIGIGFNIFFNWMFIFGNWGMPQLGADGCALSTILVRLIMTILIVIWIFSRVEIKKYLPPLISHFNTIPVIYKITKIGFPTSIQLFAEVVAYAMVTSIIGWTSISNLAAHQILLAIVAINYMFATGLSVAISITVATAIGENKINELKSILKNGLFLTIGLFMFFSIMFYFNEVFVYRLLTHEKEVLDVLFILTPIIIVFNFFNSIQSVLLGFLRSVQDVKFSAYTSILTYWLIGVLLSFILYKNYQVELYIIWTCLLFSLLVSVSVLSIRVVFILKKGVYNYNKSI